MMIPEWMRNPEVKQQFIKLLLLFIIISVAGSIIGSSFPQSSTVAAVQNSYGMPISAIGNATGTKVPEYEPNVVMSVLILLLNDMIIASVALVATIYTNYLLPYAIVAANSFSIGVAAGKYATIYSRLFILSSIIPHSLIGVPVMCLACAGGWYFYYHKKEANNGVLLKSLIIIGIILLLADIIETFITPGIASFVGIRYGVT